MFCHPFVLFIPTHCCGVICFERKQRGAYIELHYTTAVVVVALFVSWIVSEVRVRARVLHPSEMRVR